jgi:SAM-dependent methyltransferase
MGWSEDAARNRELWTKSNAEFTGEQAARKWAQDEITWGMWQVPEAELQIFGDVDGLDAVELGCGTAYVSAWLARRGARPVGIDITPAQLDSARACMSEFGLEFPLVEADAGATGLPDACADLVHSEFGASIWVDPYRWVPEAARLLRPGGRLVFLLSSVLALLCTPPDEGPAEERLHRPLFGLHRVEWNDGGVEFCLSHGKWIDVLRANGFEVERLVELQASESSETHHFYEFVTADWARKWPSDEIWVARKHEP